MLAKTNLTNPDEWKLRMRDKYQRIILIDNPVFCTMSINCTTATRHAWRPLKPICVDFLGVKADMPEPVKEGKSSKPKLQKMDICEPEFAALRAELVEIGNAPAHGLPSISWRWHRPL
jgi:hypothetical protein